MESEEDHDEPLAGHWEVYLTKENIPASTPNERRIVLKDKGGRLGGRASLSPLGTGYLRGRFQRITGRLGGVSSLGPPRPGYVIRSFERKL